MKRSSDSSRGRRAIFGSGRDAWPDDTTLFVFGDCPKIERSFKYTKVAWNISRTLFWQPGKIQDLLESGRTEAELIPPMEKFSERASEAKLKTNVHGLRSTSVTTAAVCAGFDYVDGDAITSLADAPTKSYPLSVESQYAHLAVQP